jgi:dUTP pyrophosphatase
MEFNYKKTHPEAKINPPAKEGDVGYDIHSLESKWVWFFKPQVFKTGIIFELPKGYFTTVRTRSGHGIKHHLRVHPGTVDNGFRGDVNIKLYNLGLFPYKVKKGEKIAQIVVQPSIVFPLKEVKEVSETERGSRGFGSTGK